MNFKESTYDLFNQPVISTAAETGANLAAKKAEHDRCGWKDEACRLLEKYVDANSQPFQAEDFRQWAYTEGLEKPNSERAFGWLFIKASREGLIEKYGCGPVTNKTAHSANATIWIKKCN